MRNYSLQNLSELFCLIMAALVGSVVVRVAQEWLFSVNVLVCLITVIPPVLPTRIPSSAVDPK
jgi:hypothetical protein